jgi:ABC-2 type transport system permease protein
MNPYFLLLTPRVLSFRNRLRKGEEGSLARVVLLGLVALAFWMGVFYGFFKVLAYFNTFEGFGHILAHKLMGMVWITFLAVLLFSNVITSLSTYFLSKDLQTIHASPVSGEAFFWARLTDTLVDSSWMVVLFGLPIFAAYGIVFDAGALYYGKLVLVLVPYLVLVTSVSVIFTLVLVNVFPAQRTKDILFLLGILLVIVLYLLFRFIRPERLANPDQFISSVSYFASLSTPTSPYLPSEWATNVLWPHLRRPSADESWFYLGLLSSTAAALAVIASWVSAALYDQGFSKSQEGARRLIRKLNPVEYLIRVYGRFFHPASRQLIAKDIRTFFRDNTQWSQLLLLLALIVIYLYNFSVLDLQRSPIVTFFLQNVISFLNIGLASFVVASLAVRFVFPAVSQEGFSYWIIRSSPLSLTRFLWTKFAIYAPPLVLVAEALIVLSNRLLNVSPFMMALSAATIFFLTLGIVSLGVGLGAVYPRFETENLAQVATGFGGFIFMVTSALYVALVVVLEAWPVYTLLRAEAYDAPLESWRIGLMILCFAAAAAINVAVVFQPMRMGRRHLLAREAR